MTRKTKFRNAITVDSVLRFGVLIDLRVTVQKDSFQYRPMLLNGARTHLLVSAATSNVSG